MVLMAYKAVFQDGQIKLQEFADLQEGDELIVTILKSAEDGSEDAGISGAEILNSGMIGIWADRDDIGDSAEFAEKIRRRWENRQDTDDSGTA